MTFRVFVPRAFALSNDGMIQGPVQVSEIGMLCMVTYPELETFAPSADEVAMDPDAFDYDMQGDWDDEYEDKDMRRFRAHRLVFDPSTSELGVPDLRARPDPMRGPLVPGPIMLRYGPLCLGENDALISYPSGGKYVCWPLGSNPWDFTEHLVDDMIPFARDRCWPRPVR